MKINFKILTSLILATSISISSIGQITVPCDPPQNQNANPQITTATPNDHMVVGGFNVVEFRFQDAGDDPIPANTIFIDISIASTSNFEFVAPYLNPDIAYNGIWEVDLTHTAGDAIRLINKNGSIPDGDAYDLQLIVNAKIASPKKETYSVYTAIFGGASATCVGDAINTSENNTKKAFMTAPVVVPVTLTGFTGTLDRDESNLNWTVENESGIANYEVLRSTNGSDYVSVGKVAANNSKGYNLLDNVAGKGNQFFYRLKINSNDNTFSYSQVIVLSNSANDRITIYPNPVSNVVNISSLKGIEMINIFSVDGRRMIEQKAIAGKNTVDISKLARGTYNLVISNGLEVSNYKIVKIKY